MLILTAFNSAFSEIGSLCVQSLKRYCLAHPEYRFVAGLIPDNYDRPASWYKVTLLQKHLQDHDMVLWIDADAMIVGNDDLRSLLKNCTLNISKDDNGINCGVMAWKNCEESFKALERMNLLYGLHSESPHWEQAALREFVDELDVCYQPKEIFNAYGKYVAGESDVCEKTMICHWPGMGFDERRLEAMKEALAA